MKNKDGFISMTLVYTFLILFMFIMLAIINSYTQKNHFLDTIDSKINEDLKEYMGINVNILNKLLKDNIALSANEMTLTKAVVSDGSNYLNGNGFYYLDSDEERIYFFRGSSVNNFIVVNGSCFRIIRTNENGSIRMIYYNNNSTCNGVATPISNSVYNDLANSNAYVGYMFGNPNGGTFNETHENSDASKDKSEYTSRIKKVIDAWYEEKLMPVEDKISNAVYCNNRSLKSGTGYAQAATTYDYDSKLFSFECEDIDSFELHITSGGNSNETNSLEYGIALPTYLDLVLAGSNGSTSSYLNYGNYKYWLMTASEYDPTNGAQVLSFNSSNGNFDSSIVTEINSVFPVISLSSNVKITKGSGKQGSPYEIG